MPTPTIHQLRARGFKVRVTHERYVYGLNPRLAQLTRVTKVGKKAGTYGHITEKGGMTTIEVSAPGSAINEVATSVCSRKDAFNRRLGNTICLSRLHTRGVI